MIQPHWLRGESPKNKSSFSIEFFLILIYITNQ